MVNERVRVAAKQHKGEYGMPHVDDNGVKLWYRVKGSGEPLVLSGGFGLRHNQFDYVVDILAKKFHVIDWHYRGARQSDRAWVGGYPLDRWVDDLEIILNHLLVRVTCYVKKSGHSALQFT